MSNQHRKKERFVRWQERTTPNLNDYSKSIESLMINDILPNHFLWSSKEQEEIVVIVRSHKCQVEQIALVQTLLIYLMMSTFFHLDRHSKQTNSFHSFALKLLVIFLLYSIKTCHYSKKWDILISLQYPWILIEWYTISIDSNHSPIQ